MNERKEKSAVGSGIPSAENENNHNNSITDNSENINSILEKLNTLPFTKRDARNFTRFMTSGAITLEFDKQGRINIPNYLNEYANLLKDVVIVGVINRIEIWSKDKWEEFMNNNVESLSDISENLFMENFDL